MAARSSPVPALLLAAALLGPAAPAAARAPAAAEQGSLDWVLERLAADRAEDAKGPRLDPLEVKCNAYRNGETPFDEWTPVADVLKNTSNKVVLRQKATDALIGRLELERQRGADPGVQKKTRKDICNYLLDLVTEKDPQSQNCIFRIIEACFPGIQEWRPGDTPGKRAKAKQDLGKAINKR